MLSFACKAYAIALGFALQAVRVSQAVRPEKTDHASFVETASVEDSSRLVSLHSTVKELNEVLVHALQQETGDVDSALRELNNVVTSAAGNDMEGNTGEESVKTEQTQYMRWASELKANQAYCETGFNGGHSALVFIHLSSAKVYEFDLGAHSYSKAAHDFLDSKYPGRLHMTWGDSTQTIPLFSQANPDVKCDLIVVDGGHSDDVALSDLVNFASMAAKGHRLVIDDTPCHADWCNGPTNQWTKLEQEGCVKADEKVQMTDGRGFTYGHYTPCARWPDMT